MKACLFILLIGWLVVSSAEEGVTTGSTQGFGCQCFACHGQDAKKQVGFGWTTNLVR